MLLIGMKIQKLMVLSFGEKLVQTNLGAEIKSKVLGMTDKAKAKKLLLIN